jgi:alpha-tubulin suppressor-like RCC1 family protein
MGRKLWAILVLAALVASALAGCDQNSPGASTLNILSITEGTVFVMKAGTGDWIEAEVGMSLEAGDSIRTDDNSGAEITFSEGSTIELEAGTEIEIASLDISTGTGSTTIALEQTIGSLIFRVAKIVDPASRYEVETPTGVVAVRGSATHVYVMEDGTTGAINLEGDIWAVAQGVELQVPEGQQCIIRPGEPPQLLPHFYFLTVTSTDGGSVTVPSPGKGIYDPGVVVGLVAEADEGYRFVKWTGDVDTVGDVHAARTSITMNGDYSVMANFEKLAEYDLTTSSTTGGSVTVPGEGIFTYYDDTVVNLVATANSGYYFINWTGDVGTITNVNAPITTITMNHNYSITANFGEIPPGKVALTTSSTAGGSVTTPGEGAFIYDVGEVVSLVASPAGRCRFVNWTGDAGTVANVNAALTGVTMNGDYSLMASFDITPMVAAGVFHTVGLKSDGTVVIAADYYGGKSRMAGWRDIMQVAAGAFHTVGLKVDGTVVAAGDCASGQCNVGSWTDIIQVTAGEEHTVGLKTDGTVVAVGEGLFSDYGQSNVGSWADIIQIAAGEFKTVGLKANGTVVAVGRNHYGEGDVDDWTDITQIAAGPSYGHTIGLKTDGTVVAVGLNNDGQCDVDGWTGIVQVAVGRDHTVGLKADGTVVAVGDNDDGQCDVAGWTDIVYIAAGQDHTVGLKTDGTVVAVGSNYDGQCDVGDWDLN